MDINEIIILVTGLVGFLTAVITTVSAILSSKQKESLRHSFQLTVQGLFSSNIDERISSAILLRRFLNRSNKEGRKLETYKSESINVISALLKKEKCSEYQKTLADSLSYTINLDKCDFQYANLQNAYIAPNDIALGEDFVVRKCLFFKKALPNKISMRSTDMYMADLSHSSINNIDALGAVFCKANLHRTVFRNCNLTSANLSGAYLDGAKFKNCIIDGMDINDSYGVPIFENCTGAVKVSDTNSASKKVFISCPGALTPKQVEFLHRVEENFKGLGISVTRYPKHKYRETGQLSAIKTEIANSNGVVVLAFKDMKVVEGRYRPNTEEFRLVSEEIVASPWINIEAGIASGTNKPILLLFDERLNNGLFDDIITDHQITKIKINSTNYAVYDAKIDEWIRQIN